MAMFDRLNKHTNKFHAKYIIVPTINYNDENVIKPVLVVRRVGRRERYRT